MKNDLIVDWIETFELVSGKKTDKCGCQMGDAEGGSSSAVTSFWTSLDAD